MYSRWIQTTCTYSSGEAGRRGRRGTVICASQLRVARVALALATAVAVAGKWRKGVAAWRMRCRRSTSSTSSRSRLCAARGAIPSSKRNASSRGASYTLPPPPPPPPLSLSRTHILSLSLSLSFSLSLFLFLIILYVCCVVSFLSHILFSPFNLFHSRSHVRFAVRYLAKGCCPVCRSAGAKFFPAFETDALVEDDPSLLASIQ